MILILIGYLLVPLACVIATIHAWLKGGSRHRRMAQGAATASAIILLYLLILFGLSVSAFARQNPDEIFSNIIGAFLSTLYFGLIPLPAAAIGGALGGMLTTCFRLRPYGSRSD